MLLSVLSALARLDLDPWLEAANLARMPKETATERMIALIAALPDTFSGQQESAMVAARLITLLPRRKSNGPSRVMAPGGAAAVNSRTIFFVILMAFLLAAQLFMAGRQLPAQADRASAPASGIVTPPISGQ